MFNNLRKFLRVGISHNKQSLNSCFCSLITAFVLVSGAINIARADVCFLPAGQGCEQVPYEEYDSTAQTYPTDCYATKSEAMSARTNSMDSYYQNGNMWCIKSSCSGYDVTSMLPGGWNCQNCNDLKSKNYNKYKCSCNLENVTPGIGYTIDLERCEEKPSACPSYASTDCVPDECHECNSINSANPVYSGGKECLIYSTVDEHCPDGYSTNEPAGGCYATQDMLCGEGKCYKAVDAPECGEGKRLAKANGVCSCVSECNANEYASEDVCKQNADECLQNDENNCWFAREFVQIYYSNTGGYDECTKNEQLYVGTEPCPNNRCKAYIGQEISIKYENTDPVLDLELNPDEALDYQCSHQYLLGKGRYEDIWDDIIKDVSDAVTPIDDSIVMNDDTINTYGLGDFVRTKSVDWAYEDEDKWLGIVKMEDLRPKASPQVQLSWTVPTNIGVLHESRTDVIAVDGTVSDNNPTFTNFYLYLDKIVDDEDRISNGLKIPYDIKIEITYEPTYRIWEHSCDYALQDPGLHLCLDPMPAAYLKEFNCFPYDTEFCCYYDWDSSNETPPQFETKVYYHYDSKLYKQRIVEKMKNFYVANDYGERVGIIDGTDIWIKTGNGNLIIGAEDLDFSDSYRGTENCQFNRITVGITIPKDTIELKQETIESYKGSKDPLLLWSADYIPDFGRDNIISVKYYYVGVDENNDDLVVYGNPLDTSSPDFGNMYKGFSPDFGSYAIMIKKKI